VVVICALILGASLTPFLLADDKPAGKPPQPGPDPKAARKVIDDVPLAFEDLLLIQRSQLAVLGLGGGLQPQVGLFCTVSAYCSGELPELGIWTFERFFDNPQNRKLVAAATLPLLGCASHGCLTEVVTLHGGNLELWTLHDTNRVSPLSASLLPGIRDEKALPGPLDNEREVLAYCEALVKANRTAARAFDEAARKDLFYQQLYTEPKKYRGEVVRIQGHLRRLTYLDPPLAAKVEGVTAAYEAWVFSDVYGANPFCVLITELPPGLKPQERMDREVTFSGYFFKKYGFRGADNKIRFAPLLIGKTLKVAPPPESDKDWAWGLGPLFLTGVVVTAGTVVGLALWFRRGDHQVRHRLGRLRTFEFVEPAPDRIPLAAPLAQPVPPPGSQAAAQVFPINRLEGLAGGPGHLPEAPSGPPQG